MSGWKKVFRRSRFSATVGGDALKVAFQDVFGDQEPVIFEFGDIPVLAFRTDEPLPHYFYSTFGISRVNSTTPVAGTQTELTLRIPIDEELPPAWPAQLLTRLAKYQARTGNILEPGHHVDFALPLIDDSTLTSLIFVTDPILGLVDTVTGWVRFTYGIGLTPTDLDDALIWDARKFAGVFGEYHPLGLTKPFRQPLRTNAEARAIISKATEAQGSSLSAVMANYLDFTDELPLRIDLTTTAAEHLLRAVRYRIRYGKPFALVGRRRWVELVPGEGSTEITKDHVRLPIAPLLRDELLATFDVVPGTYSMTTAPLTLQVIDPNR